MQLNILPNTPNIEKPNSQRWKITSIGYLALMHEKMQLIFLLKYGRSVQLNILCYIIHRVLSKFEIQVQNYLLGKPFDLVSKSTVWFNIELFKGCLFSESMLHFYQCPQNVPKLSWKRDFEIALCLVTLTALQCPRAGKFKIQSSG